MSLKISQPLGSWKGKMLKPINLDVETILGWKCASCHNGVHFCDSSTSKSGLRPWVFDTFDLEMCFAPQRRALFHLSSGQLAPHPPL